MAGVDDSDKSVDPEQQSTDAASGVVSRPARTPMYQAYHALRYLRQSLIRDVRAKYGTPLICFITGNATSIDRDDTVFFVDLLHNVERGRDLDLLASHQRWRH
jgi:hypothetical protein